MARELWTSPITGHRRRGTRMAEFRSVLGDGITAHAIFEPLRSCPADALASEMQLELRERDFDVAGVQVDRAGPVTGFVAQTDLISGYVRDHEQPITARDVLSDATPLPDVLLALKDRPYSFVLVGLNVEGIVARADLNKPPVRVYVFGLISLLEMHLSFWIKTAYSGDEWKNELHGDRIKKAQWLQKERAKRGEVVELIDCLQFCDKRELVLLKDKLRSKMSLGDTGDARELLEAAEMLRDSLAHSSDELVGGSSWEEVVETVERLQLVLEASDSSLEAEFAHHVERGEYDMWGGA